MTGREKILAAFSPEGTREIPAVICYEGIFIRDHWDQVTDYPWWFRESFNINQQIDWRRQTIARMGQDWFQLPRFPSTDDQRALRIEVREQGVFRIDCRTGVETLLERPQIGGWSGQGVASVSTPPLPETPEEIDLLIPLNPSYDPYQVARNGSNILAARLLESDGRDLFPLIYVDSPMWGLYSLWGFEGMMLMIATKPDLVKRAVGRLLMLRIDAIREAAVLGAAGIWISECLTDMISPRAFADLNVPFIREMVSEIRAQRMFSIYGYCGDPVGKWDLLFRVGADALALEESKKTFIIDIDDVVDRSGGRCTILGNLDAIGVLQDGTEDELRTEIARQIAAGRRNGSRFLMCLGSPVTPATPVERVRLYCELVHELGMPD